MITLMEAVIQTVVTKITNEMETETMTTTFKKVSTTITVSAGIGRTEIAMAEEIDAVMQTTPAVVVTAKIFVDEDEVHTEETTLTVMAETEETTAAINPREMEAMGAGTAIKAVTKVGRTLNASRNWDNQQNH